MKQAKAKIVEETNPDIKSLSMELAVVLGPESGLVTVSPDGKHLVISEDISYDQYCVVMKFLWKGYQHIKLWIADGIGFGGRVFGTAQVNSLLEQLEFDMPVVRAAIAIGTLPKEIRDLDLNADQLVELSKAETPDELIKWGKIASEQGLNATQLRFSMAEGEVVDRALAKQLNSGVVTPHGIRQSFDMWLRRMGGIDGIQKLEQDIQSEIADELSAIVEFGLALDSGLSGTGYVLADAEPN